MFKQKINLHRHGPEPYPNIWLFPDPPIFSLPTTFNAIKSVERAFIQYFLSSYCSTQMFLSYVNTLKHCKLADYFFKLNISLSYISLESCVSVMSVMCGLRSCKVVGGCCDNIPGANLVPGTLGDFFPELNPILHMWIRDSHFTGDHSSTIQFFL